MGTLRLIGDPTPVELTFRAKAAPEFVDRTIDETGVRPPDEWEVTFDFAEVDDVELRRRLRLAYARYEPAKSYPVLPGPTEDPEQFLQGLEPWLDQVEAEEAEEEMRRASEAEAEEAVMAAFSEEMSRWVLEHGSQRLRLAVEGNYRSNTSYALERAMVEMPGFWVDTAEDCEWGERADPTEEALVLAHALKADLEAVDRSLEVQIVWLTETPRALDRKMEAQNLAFEPQEALIVPGYLGRYLLAMPLDPTLRRDPSEGY